MDYFGRNIIKYINKKGVLTKLCSAGLSVCQGRKIAKYHLTCFPKSSSVYNILIIKATRMELGAVAIYQNCVSRTKLLNFNFGLLLMIWQKGASETTAKLMLNEKTISSPRQALVKIWRVVAAADSIEESARKGINEHLYPELSTDSTQLNSRQAPSTKL